ncbi:hypothetical protein D1BOALGB6SA_9947 [Olavius sp. associated proteobacterium Delta 1]|nr:hypothetical protein D1BOALGB6SA_9947 [Olavius sp. associated proteobacterium Delta 1]
MKRNNVGFTLMEVMVAIAIMVVLSAIAVPNMIGWRERAKLRGTFANLRGDLQWAKMQAIREHGPREIVFDSNGYTIVGTTVGATTVRSRQLSAGVVFNLGASTIPVDPDDLNQLKTQFDARGRCPDDGTLVLQDSNGEQRIISINPLGQIRQE